MAGIENMAEGVPSPEQGATVGSQSGPVSTEKQISPQVPGEQNPQKPWSISSEYDPKRRGEYLVTEKDNYSVFTDPKTGKEVARVLKIAGGSALPPAEFVTFDISTYADDPKLNQIAGRIKTTGDAGRVDEEVLYKASTIIKQWDDGFEVDSIKAQELQEKLAELQSKADDPLLPYAERVRLEQQVAREKGRSEFNTAVAVYEYYMDHPITKTPAWQLELQRRKEQSRTRIEQLEQEAENDPAKPLKELFKRILESYKRIKETRVRELQGRGRESMIEQERSKGRMQEQILDDAAELAPLKAEIGGMYHYLWDGVNALIGFEEEGINRTIKNPFAERLFALTKKLRARDRMSTAEKRYTQAESYWGGSLITIFSWPESSRDMILTAMDWVKDRMAAIGERDPGTTNKLLEEIRGNGPMLLQNSLLRINSEKVLVPEGEILETNPEYLRAIAFTEGPPDVFGNEKIMKKGNTEFGPQAKERFAAKFIENFNAMFLENKYAAYLMHRLRTYKDGTYWTGHDWHIDKVEEGDIKDYRAKIQEKLMGEAETRDFFTETIFANNQDLFPELFVDPKLAKADPEKSEQVTKENKEDVRLAYKGFFELRDEYKLQYSANDPLERLLLDPGDIVRQRIAATGDAEALRRHDLRVAVFRGTKELLDREDGFDFITRQEIERIEKRIRRPLSDGELSDLAEVHKDILRAQLRQGLADPDSDQSKRWIEDQIVATRVTNRQKAIRSRIRQQMGMLSQENSYFAETCANALARFDQAKQSGNPTECDRIAWDWMRDYNKNRIQDHLPKWYASGWDRVRIKIDRAAKVIDRSLTEEEREAMYEKAYLPEASDDESKARIEDLKKGRKEDARFGFELARSFSIFLMESSLLGGMRIRMVMPKGPKAGEYTGRLADDETSVLLGLIKGRINPQTHEVEVEKDANGEAIIVDPERKSLRISDVIEARLAKAIADEEHEIEPLRRAKRQAFKAKYRAELSGDQTEITAANQTLGKAAKDLRERLRDCQFVATHAYKAKGLVNGRWPVWSHAVLDNSMIKAFGELLAEYGVEVAPGLPFADYKKEIYEYLERGRRAQFSEMRRAAEEFMEGRYPFYERDVDGKIVPERDEKGNIIMITINGQQVPKPKPAVSLFTMSDDWGEPGVMEDRMRVVNKGDVAENTMVTEAEYNMSTSGGVKFVEYIPFAGINFLPLGVWGLGAPGIWGLNNFIKRRNEVEYHKQRFFDPTDMPKNARAQAAAYKARKALTGGSLGEGQFTPGFLIEPFDGAYTVADWLRGMAAEDVQKLSLGLEYTRQYVGFMNQVRSGERSLNDPEVERVRQLTYIDYYTMAARAKIKSDEFYKITYQTFKNFVTWLKVEKEVEENRIGNAPRNYAYENTLRWYAFRRLMRESIAKGERGIIQRLGYSPEIACEQSLRMLETGMMDAEYLILRDYERNRLAQEGALILSKVLNDTEKQKGRALLNEETWDDPNMRSDVKKALQTVRRRGLLEFMREEGFFWYTLNSKTDKYEKENILNQGEKIPPIVRQAFVARDKQIVRPDPNLIYKD